MFTSLKTVYGSFTAVKKIASLMNANTRRRDLLENRLDMEERIVAYKATGAFWDDDCICVAPKTEVQYTVFAGSENPIPRNFRVPFPPAGFMIEQGQLLLLTANGKDSIGKQTVLKALAHLILPSKGFVYVPEELDLRYLPSEPRLFDTTVYENLKFGNKDEHTGAEMREMCRLAALSPSLYEDVAQGPDSTEVWGQTQVGAEGSKISLSDRIKINIIRAFFSSVDLLLMHNTLDGLGTDGASAMLQFMSTFVTERGTPCLASDTCRPVSARTKKTIIFSSKDPQLSEFVDGAIILD